LGSWMSSEHTRGERGERTPGGRTPGEPSRAEVEELSGVTVLEFGASWCGVCQGTRSLIDRALAARPGVRHLLIEDGKGKRLGRSFGVKLWPTLVLLHDGREVARLVRPQDGEEISAALATL